MASSKVTMIGHTLRVQRLYRGQVVRARVAVWHAAGLFIERVFRGHLGRCKWRAEAEEAAREAKAAGRAESAGGGGGGGS